VPGPVARGLLLALLLPAGGCLDDLLEAPYVLTTALPPTVGLAPSGRGQLMAATSDGVYQVDGEGHATLLVAGEAKAVGAHAQRLEVLRRDRIDVYTWPADGPPAMLATWPTPGAVDLQSWCEETLLVAYPDRIDRMDPETGAMTPYATGLEDVRSLCLGAKVCETTWVATRDALVNLGPEGVRQRVPIDNPHAVAIDSQGTTWALHGEPRLLSAVLTQGPTVIARHLGDARDVHFGPGGLLPPQNVYLAAGEGGVDYARLSLP
jgi:hypothetical protein